MALMENILPWFIKLGVLGRLFQNIFHLHYLDLNVSYFRSHEKGLDRIQMSSQLFHDVCDSLFSVTKCTNLFM